MAEDKHPNPEEPPRKPQDDTAGKAAGEGKEQPKQSPPSSTTGADKPARKTEKTTAGKTKPKASGSKDNAPDKAGDKAGDKAAETKDKDGDKGKTPPPPKTGTKGGNGGKPPTSGLLFRALFTLAIIAVLGVAGYYAWQEYGNQWRQAPDDTAEAPAEEPSAPPARAEEADNELARQVSQLEGRLESEIRAQREETETLRDQVAELQLQLSSQGERLHQLATATREDWLLAEAEYLLRLASQRILTERQTGNALALMETADRILRDMDQPDLFPVRKALADDINALRMAGTLDREGLYLRLEALRNAVDELGLDTRPRAAEAPGMESTDTDAEAEATPAPEAPWYAHLITNARATFGDMAGLVRVERRDVPLRAMLTADQEAALRHNLRIFMEQAQLALMQENDMVYQSSLAKAEHWIDNHFENSRATQTVLEELTALREKDIAPERPAISRSINALKDYIDYWHNRHRNGTEQESSQ